MISYDANTDILFCESQWTGSRNFLDAVNKEMVDSIEPFVFPQGLLTFSKNKLGVLAAFQVPPRAVMTKWNIGGVEYDYFLSFPYIIFLNYFRKVRVECTTFSIEATALVYFSNSPVTDFAAPVLYDAYLPNVFPWGEECRFCSGIDFLQPGTIPYLWNRYIQYFFGSTFKFTFREKGSVYDCHKLDIDRRVWNVEEWSKNSLADPSFITTVKWTGKGCSLKTVKGLFSGRDAFGFYPYHVSLTTPVFNYANSAKVFQTEPIAI